MSRGTSRIDLVFRRCLFGLACCAIAVNAATAVTVISKPDDAWGMNGASVWVPVYATPADGILGADIRFDYDPAVLTATAATTTTLSQGFLLTPNFSTPGRVILSLYGTTPMAGSGPIANVQFSVIGTNGATSVLHMTRGSLNEGTIPSALVDGFFRVCLGEDPDDDGSPNCLDPDDDGDGVPDVDDCDPLDPTASSPSTEVSQLLLGDGPASPMVWTTQGAGSRYDVIGGELAELDPFGGAASAMCLEDDLSGPPWIDPRPEPLEGAGYFYLLRAQNACGSGTYGQDFEGTDRIPGVDCP